MVIANVGGQAGLWLGCSFVTIIQAGYYLWLTFWKRMEQKTSLIIIKSRMTVA